MASRDTPLVLTAVVLPVTFAQPENGLIEANHPGRYFMDPVILAGMIFSIIVIVLLGGFTLLYPLTRRLAEVLEKRYLQDGAEEAVPTVVEGS